MDKNEKQKKDKIYVRYDEGAEMYSIFRYAPKCKAAESFNELTKEVLEG